MFMHSQLDFCKDVVIVVSGWSFWTVSCFPCTPQVSFTRGFDAASLLSPLSLPLPCTVLCLALFLFLLSHTLPSPDQQTDLFGSVSLSFLPPASIFPSEVGIQAEKAVLTFLGPSARKWNRSNCKSALKKKKVSWQNGRNRCSGMIWLSLASTAC